MSFSTVMLKLRKFEATQLLFSFDIWQPITNGTVQHRRCLHLQIWWNIIVFCKCMQLNYI